MGSDQLRERYKQLSNRTVFRIDGDCNKNSDVSRTNGNVAAANGGKKHLEARQSDTSKDGDALTSETYNNLTVNHSHTQDPSSSHLPSTNSPAQSRPKQTLSTEENDTLNKKIDLLMAALQDGRRIHFQRNEDTGEVDVFAGDEHTVLDQEETRSDSVSDGWERTIAEAERRYDLEHRGSGPMHADQEETRSDGVSDGWERAIAEAERRYDLEHRGSGPMHAVIRSAPRQHVPTGQRRRGQDLVIMGQTGVEYHSISPIPIDFGKLPGASTPSIHSNNSEEDCSSPLFKKSFEAILKDEHHKPSRSMFEKEASQHLQSDDPISTWLRDIPTPPLVDNKDTEFDRPRKAFGVFQDFSPGDAMNEGERGTLLVSRALGDISNLRRPGYLGYNSFAKGKRPANDATRRDISSPPKVQTLASNVAATVAARSLRSDATRATASEFVCARNFGEITDNLEAMALEERGRIFSLRIGQVNLGK